MSIAELMESVNASHRMSDLKQLTKETWDELHPYTTKEFSSYDEFVEYVSDKGMKPECFLFNVNHHNNCWYIENTLYLQVSHLVKFRLDAINEDFIKKQLNKNKEDIENGEWFKVYFSIGEPFQLDYYNQHCKEMPIKYQREILMELYTSHDYALKTLNTDVVRDVMIKGKYTNKLQEHVDENGYITVYRGFSPKSTPIQSAISWSLDYNVALKFATKFYERSPRLYKAKVHISDVRFYYNGRNEQEIIVFHEDLKSIEDMKLFTYKDAEKITNLLLEQIPYLNTFNKLDGIHGKMHSKRMLMYLCLIKKHIKPTLSEDEFKTLVIACIVHDLGRVDDAEDGKHGLASLDYIFDVVLCIALNPLQIETLEAIVANHCLDDAVGIAEINNNPCFKNKKRIIFLYQLFKDIDALDRVRLRDLDTKYLRTDIAKRVLGVNQLIYKGLE